MVQKRNTPWLKLRVTALLCAMTVVAPGCQSPSSTDTPPLSSSTILVPPVLVRGGPADVVSPVTLEQRMEEAGVPGLSVAVVVDGEIVWAGGFGFADVESSRRVDAETLFQAASISKPVAAAGALRQAELGVVDLDADVNDYLASWRAEPFTGDASASEATPITLRMLFSHTSGSSVSGFPGYPSFAEVPDAIAVLDGRGNTEPVRFLTPPGEVHAYSGGGFTVAQVAMVDASSEYADFPTLMRDSVLRPLGMNDSTFEQPLPEGLRDRAATAYLANGQAVPGLWHVYPEMAAAGLWTTPSDLARFFVSIQRGMQGSDGPVLTAASVEEMLRVPLDVPYGLGLNVGTQRIGHGGGNQGFRCVATFFNERGDGCVIMSNSDAGWNVNSDVLRTVFSHYGWEGLEPIERTVVSLAPDQLARCAGRYDYPGYGPIRIDTDEQGMGLVVTLPDASTFRLLPESETVFFDPADGVPISFEIDADGNVTGAVWSGTTVPRVAD